MKDVQKSIYYRLKQKLGAPTSPTPLVGRIASDLQDLDEIERHKSRNEEASERDYGRRKKE